nr:CRM-domain containing factor CFM3, chloroplastic/mitochondrial [Ipomoea batatas]
MSLSLSTAKLTEMPSHIFSTPARRPPFFLLLKPLSSLRLSVTAAAGKAKIPSRNYEPLASNTNPVDLDTETRVFDEHTRAGGTAIERIVFRLRNLGLGSDDEEEEGDEGNSGLDVNGEVKAPTMAELTIEDEELRRLRGQGVHLREKINVPKAGVTGAVLEKIHDKWRKNEVVRLKFHEALAHDMKTAHQIVERRTGGLVVWRSGSVMAVYRGNNYLGPSSRAEPKDREVSSSDKSVSNENKIFHPVEEKSNPIIHNKSMTAEEAEFNKLLDGLGPRFEDWWGTGILPVDADLLPPTVPGYKTPFRLLPTRMRPNLTNAEMTNLRKLAKSLPCHFALGRNRHHQGLAVAIIKLWEKSLIAKIAVKRGIQNTNNKLMSEELKALTGGVLLLRNKFYIVIYRGKDFVPPSVAAALAERQEITKQILDDEDRVRKGATALLTVDKYGHELTGNLAELYEANDVEEKQRRGLAAVAPVNNDGHALAGTLAEFYEAQAQWGRDVSNEEREKMLKDAARARTERVIKRLEHKLAISQAKKLKAENLLSKIVASWVPAGPSDDQETITEEERVMYRQVGLKMKSYLPLGIRGVFDGVIENMHLHWKHRELVKLISKEKEVAFVEETARLLEYESGGILVAIDRVPKGYSLIFYRGKNYRRPISLRPRNLLTKAKALKRRVALQRYEALSQHISELENNIEQTKREIGDSQDVNGSDRKHAQFNHVSELTQSEVEASWMGSDGDEDEDPEWESDEDSEYSDAEFSFAQRE